MLKLTTPINFFIQFLISPVKTGAIVPSSKKLAQLITDTSNISDARFIVEIGSGTGVFTEKIVQQISKDAIFFVLEVNSQFIEETKKRCPNAIVYQDSATHIRDYLKKHNIDKCDCIISSLPWAGFSKDQQAMLLQTVVDVLKPEGLFSTFAYAHTQFFPGGRIFRNRLIDKFKYVNKTKIIWKNLPPAFVYYCQK